MNLISRWMMAVVAILLFSSASLTQTNPVSAEHTILPATVYAHKGDADLVADLYLPKGAGPFPAIIFIHGGGWSSGDRSQLRRQAALMADRGMVGMAIDYRLAPANPYPAALEDSRDAVRWLRQHAAEYKIDPARIGAVGSSAGGHLVAMLGVKSSGEGASGAEVRAVVVLNGIFDLSAMPPGNMVSDFLGKPCPDALAACADASPVSHVRPGAPPFLVMHGDADQTAPYGQAKAFVDALKAAGDKVELYTVAGAPHTFWSKPAWKQVSDDRMAAFLERELSTNSMKKK